MVDVEIIKTEIRKYTNGGGEYGHCWLKTCYGNDIFIHCDNPIWKENAYEIFYMIQVLRNIIFINRRGERCFANRWLQLKQRKFNLFGKDIIAKIKVNALTLIRITWQGGICSWNESRDIFKLIYKDKILFHCQVSYPNDFMQSYDISLWEYCHNQLLSILVKYTN